jgi:hypothetical protein
MCGQSEECLTEIVMSGTEGSVRVVSRALAIMLPIVSSAKVVQFQLCTS